MIRSLFVLLAAFPVSVRADSKPVEPVAAFTLADGWVDFRLEKDGKPVKGARVTVLVGNRIWAQGETGDGGQGTFPRPTGTHCQVVFYLGSGPSAPIPLAFLDDTTVIPTRSPVRDGTGECCATYARRVTENRLPDEAPTLTTILRDRVIIGSGVLVVGGVYLGYAVWRTRRHKHGSSQHTQRTQRERR